MRKKKPITDLENPDNMSVQDAYMYKRLWLAARKDQEKWIQLMWLIKGMFDEEERS